MSISDKYVQFTDAVETMIEKTDDLKDLLDDLQSKFDYESEYNRWSVSPHRIEETWDNVIHIHNELDDVLEKVADLMRPLKDISAIERDLHRAIISRLRQEFGEEWWHRGIPESARGKAENLLSSEVKVKDGDNRHEPCPENFMFHDLKKIVGSNWAIFGPVFERVLDIHSKRKVDSWFEELNGIRNLLFHPPRRDIRDISDDERRFLQLCKKQKIPEIVHGLAVPERSLANS